MADIDGDDKIVGLREHPEENRVGEAAQDDVDIARIEKVYRYLNQTEAGISLLNVTNRKIDRRIIPGTFYHPMNSLLMITF